jgi:NAD-dependent deacetylase
VCLIVGTSGTVYPAASIARVAARAGATLIEVNLEPSELPARTLCCVGPAATLVPLLLTNGANDARAADAIP